MFRPHTASRRFQLRNFGLDTVLGNYVEFEEDLLRLALRHSLRFGTAVAEFAEQRRALARRVLNLLAACRYHRCLLGHSLSVMFGHASKPAEDVRNKQASYRDSSFAYRLMESVRDVLQHFADPLRMISATHQRTSMDEDFQVASTVTLMIDRATLLEDRIVCSRLAAELAKQPEQIDIKPLLREYVELLLEGHLYIREKIRPHIEGWENAFLVPGNAYREAKGLPATDAPEYWEVCCLADGNMPATCERTVLSERVLRLRHELESRNGRLSNLARRYVTNQPADRIPKP